MALVSRLGFMLAVLAAGVLARHVGLLDEAWRDRLNRLAFYVALPALVFDSIADRSLSELISLELVAGLWIVFAVAVAASLIVHRRASSRATRSVATVQSYHGNFGYFGLPFVAATLGDAAAGPATIVLGVGALTQIPVTILVLISLNDADASVTEELRSVATNPVIVSLVLALALSASALAVPAPVGTAVGAVAELALPLALVLIGSAIEVRLPTEDRRTLASVVALKVLLMPVVAWAAFSALGVAPLVRNAAVVMFGAPTAVSTFVYATELGGDAEFASVGVFATTIASVCSLGIALQFLV